MSKIAIFATDLAFGFGKGNSMPWPYNRKDMEFFKKNTLGKTLVCGSKTFETIKHLPNRGFIVVSNNSDYGLNRVSPKALLGFLRSTKDDLVIVGGTSVLSPAVLDLMDKVYVTKFKSVNPADTYLSTDTAAWLGNKPHIALYDDDEIIIREYIL